MMTLPRLARPLIMILAALFAIALCAQAQAQAGSKKTTHLVRPGETLQTISQRYYGTTRRWHEIFQANRDQLENPGQVEPGMKLRLTATTNVKVPQVRVAAAPPMTKSPTVAARAPSSSNTSGAPTVEVVVAHGDSLESLAEHYLGSAKFWPRIIELNRGTLKSPSDLHPGMKIQIEELLPRHEAVLTPVARTADQYSAIDASPEEHPAEPPSALGKAPVAVVPAPIVSNGSLPRYDEFLDP